MNNHCVTVYALSSCLHCRKAMEYLQGQCVDYNCVYVDKLQGEERSTTIATIKRHNPRLSFPTLVIDEGECVVIGFQEGELKEALKL